MRPELLSVVCSSFSLHVRGKPLNGERVGSDASYRVTDEIGPFQLCVLGQRVPLTSGEWVGAPVLFEDGEYEFYLAGPEGCSISCDDFPTALEHISTFPAGSQGRVVHHRLNLTSDVGHIRLTFRQRGRVTLRLRLEVYPTKLDYKTDYQSILADLSRISNNLVFASMARTGLTASLVHQRAVLEFEWFRILQTLFRDLLKVLDELNRQPSRTLRGEVVWRDSNRARTVDPAALQIALKRRDNQASLLRAPRGGVQSLKTVPTRDWSTTYDTSANRHVRWTLERIAARLLRIRSWLKQERARATKQKAWIAYLDQWSNVIEEALPHLRRRLSYPFLNEAGSYSGGTLPTQLQSHPVYARLFQISLALTRGLAVSQQEFAIIGSKPVWQLYEYWCYAAILEIIGRRLAFVSGDIVELDPNGSRLTLKRGVEGSVLFREPDSGREIRVIYNRLYPTPTTWQRPDTVVHIDTGRDLHVFDAKYRLQRDEAYVATYGGPGPHVDDINVMHRYRDAIINTRLPGFPRMVRSAIVLFPGSSDSYSGHRFERSIGEIGVGALPFLPSQTELVSRRIEAIVEAALA